MHLVQILLPRADNSGRPFGREDFDRVKEDLASRFDGVTAYLQAPAEGLWQDGEQSSKDDIVIFEVMVEEIDLADWRKRRTPGQRILFVSGGSAQPKPETKESLSIEAAPGRLVR